MASSKIITQTRKIHNPENTIGAVYLNKTFYCYTLEDIVRERKVYGKTAIPEGTYKVKITYSPKYRRNMILLYNTEDFKCTNGIDFWSGIRVHGGNTEKDSEGCVLVAHNTDNKRIWNRADNELTSLVERWIKQGHEVLWQIIDINTLL